MQSYLVILGVLAAICGTGTAIHCYTCGGCTTLSTTSTNCSSTQDACLITSTNMTGTAVYSQSCATLGTNTASCTTLIGVTTCFCSTDNCNGVIGTVDTGTAIQCYACTACSTPSTTPTNCSSTQDACQSVTTDVAGIVTYTQSCATLSTNTASCTTIAGVTTCYCSTDNCNSGAGQVKVSFMLATLLAGIVGRFLM